jgi:hypothetical protein
MSLAADTAFSCLETPMWFPAEFPMDQIQPCLSCVVRFTSTVAGPGNVSTRTEGLLLNENPLTTLTINGIQHTLLETVLSFPGGHRLLNRQSPCDAELYMYFRSIKNISDVACFCIPIDIGAGESNKYFDTLDVGVVRDRPTVGTVIPTTDKLKLLMYRGADLRGRSGTDSTPRRFCDPIASLVTYYVCLTPSLMSATTFQRLKTRAGTVAGPPKPNSPPVQDRIRRICSIVSGLTVQTTPPSADTGKGAGAAPSTAALKCYRINPERDIKDGKVYVGGTGATTLAKELETSAADAAANLGVTGIQASVQPGDIEKVLGIVLGVIVGLVICAAIGYYLWKYTFKNYDQAQSLYESVIDPANLTNTAVAAGGIGSWLSSFWKPAAPAVCAAPAPAQAGSNDAVSVGTNRTPLSLMTMTPKPSAPARSVISKASNPGSV